MSSLQRILGLPWGLRLVGHYPPHKGGAPGHHPIPTASCRHRRAWALPQISGLYTLSLWMSTAQSSHKPLQYKLAVITPWNNKTTSSARAKTEPDTMCPMTLLTILFIKMMQSTGVNEQPWDSPTPTKNQSDQCRPSSGVAGTNSLQQRAWYPILPKHPPCTIT